MAKALIGYLDRDQPLHPAHRRRLATENARLRARVAELEALVLRLAEENDRLAGPRGRAARASRRDDPGCSPPDRRVGAGTLRGIRLSRGVRLQFPPVAWTYRPSLDGLRSVAVYLVLLFHTGLAALGGGFVGVDLFFVLSGFLVTSVILNEVDTTGRLAPRRLLRPPGPPAAAGRRGRGRRHRAGLPAGRVGGAAAAARRGRPERAALLRELALPGPVQRLLRRRRRQEPVPALLVAGDRGAVLPRLPAAAGRSSCGWPVGTGTGCCSSWWPPLLVLSVAAQLYWAGADANHAYYGTDARLYQLLAGALLALAPARPGAPADGPAAPRDRSPAPGCSACSSSPAAWSRWSPSTRGAGSPPWPSGLVIVGLMQAGERGLVGGVLSRRLAGLPRQDLLRHLPVALAGDRGPG